MIRTITLLLSLLAISCQVSRSKTFNPRDEVIGNWLILYPQHILKTDGEREEYRRAQDSIVNLFGLKLVSFTDDGKFIQLDSIFAQPGEWAMDSLLLNIRSKGKGFERFAGRFAGVVNDTIMITEFVTLGKEEVKLVWHLKKIHNSDDASELFVPANNWWRKKPTNSETDEEIRKRLVAMFQYYSEYYELVSKESIYFSALRVFLPFSYYQHGIGLKAFSPSDPFTNLFYDQNDAKKAYYQIDAAMKKIEDDPFPSGEDFVIEYSKYLERLANIFDS